MTFYSILFPTQEARKADEPPDLPDFFVDLNLNQVVEALTFGRQEYDLAPFYYAPLSDADAISYRQEIARDLEDKTLAGNITSFAQKMVVLRRYIALSAKLYNQHHQAGWFLEAVLVYCDAVAYLVSDLSKFEIRSRGLSAFRSYLTDYAGSERFSTLSADAAQLKADLASIKYCVRIKDSLVRVRRYEEEVDYSTDVEATFAKFKQGAVKDYRLKLFVGAGLNSVETRILDLVAKLYPEAFSRLHQFSSEQQDFTEQTILDFDREVQFYIAYLEHISRMKRAGLQFCYPNISRQNKEIFNYDGFDISLATKHIREDLPIVPNDFYLKGKERVIVVSGPNQGGKTTFARTFGQLHYLACLGLPVPGQEAQLYLFDRLLTHFEREEHIANLRGKLQDDLVRIHAILEQATSDSVLVLNEIFASTTLEDALFLSERVMEEILRRGLLCVWVTFIDELSTFGEETVSMVSTVVPENPAMRTYKVIRKPADGLAYAMSIVEKHHLTYECIMRRIET